MKKTALLSMALLGLLTLNAAAQDATAITTDWVPLLDAKLTHWEL